MNKYDFYKDLYFFELKRKNEILIEHSIPITIITACIAAFFYFANNVDVENLTLNVWATFFLLFISPSIIAIFLSLYYMWQSFSKGFEYKYLPTAVSFHKKFESISTKEKNEKEKKNNKEEKIVIEKLIECATINSENNLKKTRYLHKSKKYIVIALACIFLSSICFYGYKYNDKNIEQFSQKHQDEEKAK